MFTGLNFFLFHFGLETVRHLCFGKNRVGFNVFCSLHITVREETQISITNMLGNKPKASFLVQRGELPIFY